jgi:hypothetical protein
MDVRGEHRWSRDLRAPVCLLILWTLAACTTSHVIVGHPRSPITTAQVQVYLQLPARSEEIALLQTSSRGSFAVSAQARMDKVIDRLRKEAAALGANGILIQSVGDRSSGSVVSGFSSAVSVGSRDRFGTGVAANILATGGNAIAIYVPAESAGEPRVD